MKVIICTVVISVCMNCLSCLVRYGNQGLAIDVNVWAGGASRQDNRGKLPECYNNMPSHGESYSSYARLELLPTGYL